MTQNKSISFIYKFSNLLYFASIALSIIIVSILAYILFGGSIAGIIKMDILNISADYTNFNQTPFFFRFIIFTVFTIILSIINIILRYWKNFISLIQEGKYFEINTIKKLKLIAFFLSFTWLAFTLLGFFISNSMGFSAETSWSSVHGLHEPDFSQDLAFSFNFPSLSFLITALILWVLAHIMTEGIKMKDENELTI